MEQPETREIIAFTPKEKTFLSVLSRGLHQAYTVEKGEKAFTVSRVAARHEYLDVDILRSICKINPDRAIAIVQNEEVPRIEILAEFIVEKQKRQENTSLLAQEILSLAKQTKEERRNFRRRKVPLYSANQIARTASVLQPIEEETSESLISLAKQNILPEESLDQANLTELAEFIETIYPTRPKEGQKLLRRLKEQEKKEYLARILEHSPPSEHGKERQRLKETDFEGQNYRSAVSSILESAYKQGDFETVTSLIEKFGFQALGFNATELAAFVTAQSSPEKIIDLVNKRFIEDKKDPSYANAVSLLSKTACRLLDNNFSHQARVLSNRAEEIISSIPADEKEKPRVRRWTSWGEYPLDPPSPPSFTKREGAIIAMLPFYGRTRSADDILSQLKEIYNNTNDPTGKELERQTNKAAVLVAQRDPEQAIRLYQLTKDDSEKKLEAAVNIAIATAERSGADRVPQELLDRITTSTAIIREFAEYNRLATSNNELTIHGIAALADYFPKRALKLLHSIPFAKRGLVSQEIRPEEKKDVASDLVKIFEKAGLTLAEQEEQLDIMAGKFSHQASSALYGTLLASLDIKNKSLLEPTVLKDLILSRFDDDWNRALWFLTSGFLSKEDVLSLLNSKDESSKEFAQRLIFEIVIHLASSSEPEKKLLDIFESFDKSIIQEVIHQGLLNPNYSISRESLSKITKSHLSRPAYLQEGIQPDDPIQARLVRELPEIDLPQISQETIESDNPKLRRRGIDIGEIYASEESFSKDQRLGHWNRIYQATLKYQEDASSQKYAFRSLARLSKKSNFELENKLLDLGREIGILQKSETPPLSDYGRQRFLDLAASPFDFPSPLENDFLEDERLSFLNTEEFAAVALKTREVISSEGEIDYQVIFEQLHDNVSSWQDEQSIIQPFESGAELFGYKRMFEYISRPGLSRHDALHAFENILQLHEASGLPARQFYGQILDQVRRETREYPEGTPHHHLNAIALTLNTDFDHLRKLAEIYHQLPDIDELTAFLSKPQTIFASWKNLKRYSYLSSFLERDDVVKELVELAETGNQDLYNYIRTLAFHRHSKVDMRAAVQFWRHPEDFLAAASSHTSSELHDQKKPSNYVEIPNLDLTAEELRDSLVEGRLDPVQAFSPLEIKYEIPLEEERATPPTLQEIIYLAVGKRSEEIAGKAQNPGMLFGRLNTLLKQKAGINLVGYLKGKQELPAAIKQSLEREIEALVYNDDFGMDRAEVQNLTKVRTQTVTAKIQLKSDPEAALAGNDTANCMPFGDGKNTLYTFNLNTVLFTIQLEAGGGTKRTIAQSVLTKDKDIGKNTRKIIAKMEGDIDCLIKVFGMTPEEAQEFIDLPLHEAIPREVIAQEEAYLACDNIEVAPNYKDRRNKQIIEAVYRDFFQEYMGRFGEVQGFHGNKVIIGQGNSDALTHLPHESNTFIPLAPVSYSDKLDSEVFVLDLTQRVPEGAFTVRTITVNEPKARYEPPPLPEVPNIQYLTYQDALNVAFLESKAYTDNQSLIQNLHNMENALIAKDINNSAKGRPNMSLKYIDPTNAQVRGYILAYEGLIDDRHVARHAPHFNGQQALYVSDLASDLEQKGTGLALLNGFLQLYVQNYINKDILMPIYAQTREQTSYRFIKRGLGNLVKRLGIEGLDFEVEELPTYPEGPDTMHPVIIRPVLKKRAEEE